MHSASLRQRPGEGCREVHPMDYLTAIQTLNHMLLAEMSAYQPQARSLPGDGAHRRRLCLNMDIGQLLEKIGGS